MVMSEGESQAIQKRLDAMEKAIEELRGQDLKLARLWAASYCETLYNFGVVGIREEKREAFVKIWEEKQKETVAEIAVSPEARKAFDIALRFAREFLDYIKARKVSTAEQAIDIAHSFIKKYSVVALPLKAVREDDTWVVDIDIGALAVKIAKVKVDAKTGDILSHEIPER